MDVTLENLMFRFSHLSETIFDHLDNQSLVNCKLVSKELNVYLSEQKFHQIRIIKETVAKFHELGQSWIDVFKTANTMTIMELGHAVDQFYTKGLKYTNYKGIAPVHVAAGAGNVSLFDKLVDKYKDPTDKNGLRPIVFAVLNNRLEMTKAILKISKDKNFKAPNGFTPLHYAAEKGHFELFKIIWKEAEDKYPKCILGWTPLHLAAYYGRKNICEMIVYYGELINSPDNYGRTPLLLAFTKGCVDVCMLILNEFKNKNPIIDSSYDNTALHEAAKRGYLEICELILKNTDDKNPRNHLGRTPLTLASEKDHINVCTLICHYLNKK